ncbi:hypothetical protein GUJ93_ZPchr0002g25318 [Zizania palustris]|uniref:Uncharacterized protein n=1 Tax=Zizania palustris TaxID=103762 RepID=A0A8J5SNE2_ZIZPA|nr:hypothetical protein GUJ93_ZPchr0002g25318 [Zizania palustris]
MIRGRGDETPAAKKKSFLWQTKDLEGGDEIRGRGARKRRRRGAERSARDGAVPSDQREPADAAGTGREDGSSRIRGAAIVELLEANRWAGGVAHGRRIEKRFFHRQLGPPVSESASRGADKVGPTRQGVARTRWGPLVRDWRG